MRKPPAPVHRVVRTRLGPRSQRLTMPDGSVAIVCGPPPRIDTLSCGHEVITWGRPAQSRKCEQCLVESRLL